MRWVTNSTESEYMRARQKQNRAKNSKAENWMAAKLVASGYEWTRQAMWGYRLFDFWCHELGVAVEVDGPEHDFDYDSYRDKYNYYRSAIVVYRVRNFNDDDAELALSAIKSEVSWARRREQVNPGKKQLQKHGMEMARSPSRRQTLSRSSQT